MKIIKKSVRCKVCDAKITQGRVIEIYKYIVCETCCIKLAKTDLTLIDAEDKLTSSCRCSKEEIPEECLSTCCAFPLGPFYGKFKVWCAGCAYNNKERKE